MHICFLTDSIFSFGGVQRVTAVIAKELAKRHRVTIVTFDHPDREDTGMYGLSEADISYVFTSYAPVSVSKALLCRTYSFLYRKVLPKTRLTSALYALSSFPSQRRKPLEALLSQGKYDAVVGVHAPLAIRLATMSHCLKGSKTIGWIHNSFDALYGKGSPYIGHELEAHCICQYRKLSHTVVLCHYDAAIYEQRHGFRPTVIYNPLTVVPRQQATGKNKRFLAIGRFSHSHKGFDLLIEAFHLFLKQHEHDASQDCPTERWTLDIVGEGPEQTLYETLIHKYHLEDRVFLHPFTKNIHTYYEQASFYMLSSRWEGFGLVLTEAMAHGLPVISSDLPTSKEILGETALYFPNGNVKALAEQLHVATTANWNKWSERSGKRASLFSIPRIASQWEAILSHEEAQ